MHRLEPFLISIHVVLALLLLPARVKRYGRLLLIFSEFAGTENRERENEMGTEEGKPVNGETEVSKGITGEDRAEESRGKGAGRGRGLGERSRRNGTANSGRATCNPCRVSPSVFLSAPQTILWLSCPKRTLRFKVVRALPAVLSQEVVAGSQTGSSGRPVPLQPSPKGHAGGCERRADQALPRLHRQLTAPGLHPHCPGRDPDSKHKADTLVVFLFPFSCSNPTLVGGH